MKISACIITLNEEKNLPRCLKSIQSVVDEIVVIDSGSSDQTREIAVQFGVKMIEKSWSGYVAQKNFAISQSTHPWILSVDADEELSPQLMESIRKLRQNESNASSIKGFAVSRLVYYRNHWIRHGDWFPDILVRLFQKDFAHFEGGHVHERLKVDGAIAKLEGALYHYTYQNREDREKRIQHYAKLWAVSALERGAKANSLSPFFHALARFCRGYFLKLGFLDGAIGFEVARGNAKEVYLKYQNLLELRKRNHGK